MSKRQGKTIGTWSYYNTDIIGKGSFGTVYKGYNTKTDELVAIKVIEKKNFKQNPQLKAFLQNEIQILRELNNNENIVKLLNFSESSNNYYVIQEFCEGGDLRSYLKEEVQLTEQEAISILKQILNGYKELYKKGIVHRDLKPENILYSGGKFKLGDFGFSRHIKKTDDLLNSYCGSPLYESPQILNRQPYTCKSDIWSIMLIFYEMMVGQTPWRAKNIMELKNNIKKLPVSFPKYTDISQETKVFIQQGLQDSEEKRMSWDEIFQHPLIQIEIKDANDEETQDSSQISQDEENTSKKLSQDVKKESVHYKKINDKISFACYLF